ncbi:MAG: GNAT family N-acetyltransferase [Mycobacterium sp.]
MSDLPTVALRRCAGAELDAAVLHALLELRVGVFVVEQACPYQEVDGRDLEPQTRHFWLEGAGGEVISTLRLMTDSPGVSSPLRIGRVCTRAGHRGRGHSGRLLQAALAEVGQRPCRISAQTYLSGMYARHGFVADGEEFVEDGIPHVPMLRGALR